MTPPADAAAIVPPELVLKTTPPRTPRNLLVRARLGLGTEQFASRDVIFVQAPPGFGKTALLAQWRREHLARGATVAWLSAEAGDDPQRFLQSLVLSVRVGCGRPGFGRQLLDGAVASIGELEGMTAWLAEVAQLALEVVLIIDEAERLGERGFNALVYLVHNTPPNLRMIVAARTGLEAAVDDLLAYGQGVLVKAEALRFRLDETISLVKSRFGAKVDADASARLHEITEGWPLGLQIALSAMERSADPRQAIDALSSSSRDEREQLIGGLVAKLPPGDADFLTRIAVVDLIHPDLCRALTGMPDAPEILARLVQDTPIFVVGDASEWCRLHNLARDALRARLAGMAKEAQAELHARAMRWLAEHGLAEEAARHAYAAGKSDMAYDLAEQCLYDAVMQGQFGTVLEWLDIIPEQELAQLPRLQLAAAWALALGERHEQAGRLVDRSLQHRDVDVRLRYECALILSGAAYYADQPDRCVELFQPWVEVPLLRDARLLQIHANRLSIMAILNGDPALTRRHQQSVPKGESGKGHAYAARWGEFVVGLSYLWEGQVLLAEEVLQPAVARADADLGRRHPLSCMLAALLAAVVYERDRLDDACALLANRLDVLERAGTPETALVAYRTAARVAAAQGLEHRALDLLEALNAIGVARHLPRLCVASLAEQARMHAGRFRMETARALVQRIDEIVGREGAAAGERWRRAVAMTQVVARAHAAMADQNWQAASEALARAAPLADAMRLGRFRIEVMALRAIAQERNGESGKALLREAINLAQTYGLTRTIVDAHPQLADWVRRVAEEDAGRSDGPMPPMVRAIRPMSDKPAPGAGGPRAVPSMALTPKEREVLELLARNLSNKEIAQAMGVGDETVKWHLKNLFGKLDAGTRKHLVRRAQMLGLLVDAE